MGDTEVVDVYVNIVQNLNEKFDYVVALQPDILIGRIVLIIV